MPAEANYPGVYVQEIPSGVRTITGVPTGITAFIGSSASGPPYQPVQVASLSEFERNFGPLTRDLELGYAVQQFFLNGGTDARAVRVPDNATDTDWQAGIAALDRLELFSLLVLPGVTSQPVLKAAADYCEKRRAFLIVDAPGDLVTPDQLQQYGRSGAIPLSENAATYFPWVGIADPAAGGRLRWSPPGGTMAGVLARTDATRGVWKAPAGTEAILNGVRDLKCRITDAEHGVLNPQGINCLRSFPVHGNVAWGSRTLAGADSMASKWKYIPVRRLALFLEESLNRGTRWAVFEPNDEPLWAQLRLNVGAFMESLWRQGAFQGATPREAYFVKCDMETMTQQDVTTGTVNILVGFAPLKPAEFVVLKVQQNAGQTP